MMGHDVLRPETEPLLHRVGVIDIGSNSVRLVIFDGVSRSPAYYFSEKVLCGLGADLAKTGRLSATGRTRTLAALRRFTAIARRVGVSALIAVGTAALREAEDGRAFGAEVQQNLGLSIRIVSGDDEARLSAQGVLLGWPGANGLICDMGGASMELATLTQGALGTQRTLPLGPQKLRALGEAPDALDASVDALLTGGDAPLIAPFQRPAERLFLVGGAWRALTKIDMARRDYPLRVLHNYSPSAEALAETCAWVARQEPAALKKFSDVSSGRLPLLPAAASALGGVLRAFQPPVVLISNYGLREGLLYELMPAHLRHADPLIEGARHMERAEARMAGFGDVLFAWMAPILTDLPAAERRLAHAAALLHDILWRANPDHRADLCFDMVSRINLAGLTHEERVYLALAIMHRYKSQRQIVAANPVRAILEKPIRARSELVGRAMRLGAMVTASDPAALAASRLIRGEETLTLHLGPGAEAYEGEVVLRRLGALAKLIGRKPAMSREPVLV